MTSSSENEIERLASLIQVKLRDLERQAAQGEAPSTSELNAVRRLVIWVERERQFADTQALTAEVSAGERG